MSILSCPACQSRIISKRDGSCPACGAADIAEAVPEAETPTAADVPALEVRHGVPSAPLSPSADSGAPPPPTRADRKRRRTPLLVALVGLVVLVAGVGWTVARPSAPTQADLRSLGSVQALGARGESSEGATMLGTAAPRPEATPAMAALVNGQAIWEVDAQLCEVTSVGSAQESPSGQRYWSVVLECDIAGAPRVMVTTLYRDARDRWASAALPGR